MGCVLSRVAARKEWWATAAGLPWVTARVACSGSRVGSVRMAVVVLRIRSELRTTDRGQTQITAITGSRNHEDYAE